MKFIVYKFPTNFTKIDTSQHCYSTKQNLLSINYSQKGIHFPQIKFIRFLVVSLWVANFISWDSDFRSRKCQFLVGLAENLWATNFVLRNNGFDVLKLRCPKGSVGYNSRFVGNIFFSLKLYFLIFRGYLRCCRK